MYQWRPKQIESGGGGGGGSLLKKGGVGGLLMVMPNFLKKKSGGGGGANVAPYSLNSLFRRLYVLTIILTRNKEVFYFF